MISENITLGEGARVHPLAYVEDEVQIGQHTEIGPFCIIRRGAIIGDHCKLTAYCEIRENVRIGNHTSFGSRCTISANCEVGSRVVIKYAFVMTDTPDLNANGKKVSAKIGDGVLIGANVTLMPGMNIGKGAVVGACSQVRDHIGPQEVWFGNPAKFFKNNTK